MPSVEKGYVYVPEFESDETVLPQGIERVGHYALAACRLLPHELASQCGLAAEGAERKDTTNQSPDVADAMSNVPIKIAAFDFDGTSIDGNSPVMLVRYLYRRHMLTKRTLMRILLWAGRYKARLPQNEASVRAQVFTAFRGQSVARVNAFLRRFYDAVVAKRFRPQAYEEMKAHIEAGHVVVCISATFEPIIAQAMVENPIQFGIATRMQIDENNCYRDKVDGEPVEGPEKLVALTKFANEVFGEGTWELTWAYGDHHSDRALLAAARYAYAVTPDRPLSRTAKSNGYRVLEWENR